MSATRQRIVGPGRCLLATLVAVCVTVPVLAPVPAGAAGVPLAGTLQLGQLRSRQIGRELPYLVYLPPDYLTSERRYPVLYMLHGAGGDYTEWSDSFLPEWTDELIRTGEIQPMIVVMPDGGERSYFSNLSNGTRWADYLAYEVVPTIDATYRTVPAAEARAIGGLSGGGLGALALALNHPDLFGAVGGHSPSLRLEP